MYIGEKSKIKINKAQALELKKHFDNTRFVYNHFASKINEALKNNLDIDFNEFKNEIIALINEKDFLKFSPRRSYYIVLKHLKLAYLNVKGKKNFINYKKANGYQSITFPNDLFTLRKLKGKKRYYIRVYNIKTFFKVYYKRDFKGYIANATVSYDGLNYYVSFLNSIERDEYNRTHYKALTNTNKGVGIDIGTINHFTLSCGAKFNIPDKIKKLEARLRREMHNLSRKQFPKTKEDKTPCSNNFYKQVLKIRKINVKIRNLQTNYAHQLSALVLKFFDYFCLEDIDFDEWFSKRSLAKSLQGLCLGKFKDYLTDKINRIDHKQIILADVYYPSSKLCCRCGAKNNNITVFKRTFYCEKCGLEIDRDLNAAANLYKYVKRNIGANGAEFKFMDLDKLFAIAKKHGLIGERVEVKSCNATRKLFPVIPLKVL